MITWRMLLAVMAFAAVVSVGSMWLALEFGQGFCK
ncbi:membrane protein [Mycobacterium phage Indlulamithi]|uniref:Uncharacterized protein n=1 Tax=Mycobacterium phage Indlulamithi TaxID=2656582 RepID=A0A649VDX3_9CAUD|nr:membrane protein [Mycobacterium phage Indlulamithi]QGJ90152.1 hypothetical protein PBI_INDLULAMITHI_101 [Mycobacterium phage Indlulamithi]